MVGVGVFTTTGFMVAALNSAPAVLLAWLVGGLAAVCGGLSYAELGAAIPQNGGEYRLLSRVYHPAVGFIAGWIGLVVGFSAPLASYAHVFGTYLSRLVPGLPALPAGLLLIVGFSVLHAVHVQSGTRLHNVFTLGKVVLIGAFAVAALARGDWSLLTASGSDSLVQTMLSSPFAVQLVYVSFAYSGWNASAYMLGEFRDPQHDVPRVVLLGTAIVTGLYLALNAAFLAAAPAAELAAAKEDVAQVAAGSLFGPSGGWFVTLMVALGLMSTASALLLAGPRMYEAAGKDFRSLRVLTARRAGGGPIVAIALQALFAIVLLLSASFETLLSYIGVTLSLSASATVLGVYLLRRREPGLNRPYRTWGYPWTPGLFLLLEGWMVVHALWSQPVVAGWAAGTLVTGAILYRLVVRPGDASRDE